MLINSKYKTFVVAAIRQSGVAFIISASASILIHHSQFFFCGDGLDMSIEKIGYEKCSFYIGLF